MIFDDYFDDIVILSLPDKGHRYERCRQQLFDLGLSKRTCMYPAIHGDSVGVSAWFKWGGGAWGCMLSHARILEDFCMKFGYNKRDFNQRKLLILEDDAIFDPNSEALFKLFTKKLPHEWDQFYLGGQHTREPKVLESGILNCKSVNRTHAYAVNGYSAPHIHKHITYFPDYRSSDKNHHVDHQLELAHRRGDWKVYAPKRWIVGQGENRSDISGKNNPDMWWDWDFGDRAKEQNIIINISKNKRYTGRGHHYGYNLEEDGMTAEVFSQEGVTPKQIRKEVKKILDDSWNQRQVACYAPKNEEQAKIIENCFQATPLYV